MQTFLPHPDFQLSAMVLDYKRLGKQRVEAFQILNALRDPSHGWRHHPAVKMWIGYDDALGQYMNCMISEWVNRGYNNTMKLVEVPAVAKMPTWFGDDKFHASHRSNLLRKFSRMVRSFWVERISRHGVRVASMSEYKTQRFDEWVKKWRVVVDVDKHDDEENLYSAYDGSVGDGWIDVIDSLAKDLVSMGWNRQLLQVKEKFGGLRFYIGEASDEMLDRIESAERESLRVCEKCGSPGSLSKVKGWLKTLCAPCHEERKRDAREIDH